MTTSSFTLASLSEPSSTVTSETTSVSVTELQPSNLLTKHSTSKFIAILLPPLLIGLLPDGTVSPFNLTRDLSPSTQTGQRQEGDFETSGQKTSNHGVSGPLIEQQVESSSHIAVDGSALETRRLSLLWGSTLIDATTAINEDEQRASHIQDSDSPEITRILTAIQRIEVEIQQMRAEGYVTPHVQSYDDSSELPEYRRTIDQNNQISASPPSYMNTGGRPRP